MFKINLTGSRLLENMHANLRVVPANLSIYEFIGIAITFYKINALSTSREKHLCKETIWCDILR